MKYHIFQPLLTLFFLCSLSLLATTEAQRFICYYPNWAQFRPGNGNFSVDDIDPSLCTHYIYAYARLNDATYDSIEIANPLTDIDNKGYEKFVALKRRNPFIKTMIAIGGYYESRTGKYEKLVSDSAKITNFVNSVKNFLSLYGFDGLDMGWLYPYENYKQGFSNLMAALDAGLRPRGWLVSTVMPVSQYYIDRGYDFASLKYQVDFMNINAYDMHGAWETTVNHHAPLLRDPYSATIDYYIKYYVQKGVFPTLMNLGIPLYGKSWTLDTSNTNMYASAYGVGPAGPYTRDPGTYAYNEICQYIRWGKWTAKTNPLQEFGPYAYSPDATNKSWVGYDDIDMVKVKTEYAKNSGLGGVMVWDLSYDDFRNDCNQGVNPLLNAIKCAIQSNCVAETIETKQPDRDANVKMSPKEAISHRSKDAA